MRSILVVGESLVDVVTGPGRRRPEAAPGGAPLNIAVGLARLDVPTTLLTWFGHDPNGDLVADHLAASGVVLAPGSRGAAPTATAEAVLDADGHADYRFDLSWDPPDTALPPDLLAMHVGSLGTVLAPGADRVLALVDRAAAARVPVSYDPNVRPSMLPDAADAWADVRRLAARATVVKLSDQDAAYVQPGRDLDDLLDELVGQGRTRLAAVTRGEHGTRITTRRQRADVPSVRVEVVDTVGAGDAFMAGLLAALAGRGQLDPDALADLDVADLHAVGSAAATVAAVTCGRRGADPPRRHELDEALLAPARPDHAEGAPTDAP